MNQYRLNIWGKEVNVEGSLIRVARVAEGYDSVEQPNELIRRLRDSGVRMDVFTFIQVISNRSPDYRYPMEWDNVAALPVSTFDHWFTQQITGKTRNMLRKAEKTGVTVREIPFDDALIAGISAINNESPVRQGRRFPHYEDTLETVRQKNGTFLERSIFLGVFFEDALIGYAKLVSDEAGRQAGLMQILSMVRHRDKAPNNMLIAQAVRSCAQRDIPYLWYAKFSYGKKQRDSLSDFKEHSGFQRIDLPRYYIPVTTWGKLAVRVGLHHGLRAFVPGALLEQAYKVRNLWYARKFERVKGRA
jgi:hypothetical protein